MDKSVSVRTLDTALPIVGEMTVYTLMNIVDLIIIGNYGGNKAVTAVGLSTEILFTCTSIFITTGICIGITSLISRSIGAKKKRAAEEYAVAGLFTGLAAALLIISINYALPEKFLYFAGARGDILRLSIDFTKINVISVFFYMMTNIIASILRGYGNTKIPLIISCVTAAIKVFSDLVLVNGYAVREMGIYGSAIASILAQGTGFILISTFISKKALIKISLRKMPKLKVKALKEVIFLSLPSSLEDAAFRISRLIYTFFIMYSGSAAFAANQIASTVESISVVPGISFGLAVTTLVGIKVGEKNYKDAEKITALCAYWAILMMSVFSIIFLSLPVTIVKTFLGDYEREAIYLSALCLAISALGQPAKAVSFTLTGALQGSGDTKSPFIVSFISSFFIGFPLIYYFVYKRGYAVTYIWWINAVQWSVDAALMYIMYKKRFKKLK